MTEQSVGDRNLPMCPICGNNTFQQERGKIDSEWGMTAHKVTLLVCQRCSYVLAFYDGNTIFDFD
jgi:RNA polymerase subunit RPABC4/transcription elongation factor Spt4